MGITYNWVDKGCQESSLSGGTLELQFGDVTVDMPVIYTNGAAEKAVGYMSLKYLRKIVSPHVSNVTS